MNSTFKKSSQCNGGTCVEVAVRDGHVLVRDKDGDYVRYSAKEWKEFIAGVKLGEFDI